MENLKHDLILLENLASKNSLSFTQILFLYSKWQDIPSVSNVINITLTEIAQLISKELLYDGKITDAGVRVFSISEPSKIHSKYDLPILDSNTVEIVKRLASHFVKDKFDKKAVDHLRAYIAYDLQAPFLFLFLEMFPSQDKQKNEDWNKHFNTEWDNVTLRRLTSGTAKKFTNVWKKKDIGIFLLGTYIFILNSKNSETGKFFVKSLDNYFTEWEYWYSIAEDAVENNKIPFLQIQKKSNLVNNTMVI